jgi:hypothetical protein
MYRVRLAGILVAGAVLSAAPSLARQAQAPEKAAPSKLVEAPGKDVVLRLCSDCHEPEGRIINTRRSDDGWTELIIEMQGLGMEATRKDIDTMLAYLRKNYGCAQQQKSGPCEP